jgi:phosphopantetheinyl transferase
MKPLSETALNQIAEHFQGQEVMTIDGRITVSMLIAELLMLRLRLSRTLKSRDKLWHIYSAEKGKPKDDKSS